MSISLAALVTAFDALGTLNATTVAATATMAGLGARPTFPATATTDASYNNVLTTQATYDAAMTTAKAAYVTAVNAQKAQEDVCLALMVENQWMKVTGLANWTPTTLYIGIKNTKASNADNTNGATLYKIITSTVLPTIAFPNV